MKKVNGADVVTDENMSLWNAVCTSDPDHIKEVNFGRKFKSINAHSQIMNATKMWGPMGDKWRVEFEEFKNPLEAVLVLIVSVIYTGVDGKEKTIKQFGSCSWFMGKKPDTDAPKKALTDGLTKCLSQLGFNADVFLGQMDDSKYVNEVTEAKQKEQQEEAAAKTKDEFDKKFKRFEKLCKDVAEFDRDSAVKAYHYMDKYKNPPNLKALIQMITSLEGLIVKDKKTAPFKAPTTDRPTDGVLPEHLRDEPSGIMNPTEGPPKWDQYEDQGSNKQPIDEIPF